MAKKNALKLFALQMPDFNYHSPVYLADVGELGIIPTEHRQAATLGTFEAMFFIAKTLTSSDPSRRFEVVPV